MSVGFVELLTRRSLAKDGVVRDAVLGGVGRVRQNFDVDPSILCRNSRGIEWAWSRSRGPSRFDAVSRRSGEVLWTEKIDAQSGKCSTGMKSGWEILCRRPERDDVCLVENGSVDFGVDVAPLVRVACV